MEWFVPLYYFRCATRTWPHRYCRFHRWSRDKGSHWQFRWWVYLISVQHLTSALDIWTHVTPCCSDCMICTLFWLPGDVSKNYKQNGKECQPDENFSKLDLHCSGMYAQGPVIQSIVSLTSFLVVKILAVLVNTISNSQIFSLKKCE